MCSLFMFVSSLDSACPKHATTFTCYVIVVRVSHTYCHSEVVGTFTYTTFLTLIGRRGPSVCSSLIHERNRCKSSPIRRKAAEECELYITKCFIL